MTHIHAAHLHHQRKRFMRPDAHRFLRPDWRRFMWFGQEHQLLYQLYDRIERKYSSNQPRVPRGNPDGGQWTSDGRVRNGRQDPRILSDVTSDRIDSGTQYAQSRTRGAFGRVVINGQRVEPSPAQQVRLTVVEAQAREAIRRVQELDPKWQPAPSAYESVEGLIAAYKRMLVRRSSESLNFSRWESDQARLPASQYQPAALSGTSVLRSVERSIESALKKGATPVVLQILERLWKTS
jgi:hypothetical protein